jgi:hypothetical protein
MVVSKRVNLRRAFARTPGPYAMKIHPGTETPYWQWFTNRVWVSLPDVHRAYRMWRYLHMKDPEYGRHRYYVVHHRVSGRTVQYPAEVLFGDA